MDHDISTGEKDEGFEVAGTVPRTVSELELLGKTSDMQSVVADVGKCVVAWIRAD